MDWSRGFSATYYLTIVDPLTWIDTSRVGITDGTIQRMESSLLESADIKCVDYTLEGEQLIRVWLDARQEGSYSHTPLFTGYATSPNKTYNGRVLNTSIQCYSVLKPAEDILLPHGWYAPIDTNGATLINRLLSVCGTPIEVAPDAPYLTTPIIAESGETNLSMAWKIADAMQWQIKIHGDGSLYIGPYDDDSKWIFGVNSDDVLEQSLSVVCDWYNCPNVLMVSSNGYTAIVRDDSETSIFSTVSRGREIWAEENVDLPSDQSLTEYAWARLRELQSIATTVSYSRRYNPEVNVFDVITLNYPEQDLVGNYIVTSQNIDLGYNAKTAEEVQGI